MINSGLMRERVLLQKPATNRTGTGSANLEWEDVAEVWAAIRGLSSREVLQAMQANSIATHEVKIRFYSGIAATWRIVWRGRVMEFAGAPIEREVRSQHVILCKEVT
jgi:hypothetical protein